jgi:hypothetical protein
MGRQYLARLAANRIGERLPLPLARTRARGRDAAPGQTRSERGRSASSRLTPWSDERAENPDGQQELQAHPETPGAVPAEAVVKELPATDAGREDVVEVGGGTCRGAKRRRVEWASARGKEKDACDAGGDLKATRAEVLVRQAVAREVQEERRKSRPARRAGGGARCHVERDDRCPS